MKKLVYILLLMPMLSFSQYWLEKQNNDYFYGAVGVDARNTFFEGVNGTKGLDGMLYLGYKSEWFQLEGFYEEYRNIEYKSYGFNFYYILNDLKRFRQGVGTQISIIERPTKILPSLGVNGLLEYHINRIFVALVLEAKYRSDLRRGVIYKEEGELIKLSGIIKVGYKF